jgi:hypothetical protein
MDSMKKYFLSVCRVTSQTIGVRLAQVIHSRDICALVFLAAWHCIYFFPVTLAKGVWYTRDIIGAYYPFAVEYVRALETGRLPFWTPLLGAGFPLLAEGQVAAFYPTRVLLLRLMPAHFALSYEVLLHLIWMAYGMYFCVRGMRLGVTSAVLAGFVFSFSGFALQKIQHIPILITMAWLPWQIFFQDQFQRARRDHRSGAKWFLLFCLAAGIQWLAGFPQIAVMNSITIGLVGVFGGLFWNTPGGTLWTRLKTIPHVVVWTALPLLLGIGIAAIQIVPTMELIPFSIRASDMMNDQFRTSYALPPEFMVQFVLPFAPSDPDETNLEYWGYIGLLTFVLAISAPLLIRNTQTIFYASLAFIALSFTIGALNPVYLLLIQLPVLNMFRMPSRYLLVFTFAAVILAALACQALACRATDASRRGSVGITVLFALLSGTTIWLAYNQRIDFWLKTWQILPLGLGVLAAGILILAWTRRLASADFRVAVIGLVVFDLAAYAAPLVHTIISTTSPAYVTQLPQSLRALGKLNQFERVMTDEYVWPSIPARRSSLFPNTNVPYGIAQAHIGAPLALSKNERYIFNLSPAMFNLLNVRYFLIPLEPRPDTRKTSPPADLRPDIVDNFIEIPSIQVSSLKITGFTEDASQYGDGFVVAELVITLASGESQSFPLRVGTEIADWNYGYTSRTFAPPRGMHSVRAIPAFLRALSRRFDGYVYGAQFHLATDQPVIAVQVLPRIAPAKLTIESVTLIDANGNATSLARLINKGEFTVAYMSDTVAVWENLDVLPRAFLVPCARIIKDSGDLARMHCARL